MQGVASPPALEKASLEMDATLTKHSGSSSEISADIAARSEISSGLVHAELDSDDPKNDDGTDAQVATFSMLGLLRFAGTGFMAAVAFLDPVRTLGGALVHAACFTHSMISMMLFAKSAP